MNTRPRQNQPAVEFGTESGFTPDGPAGDPLDLGAIGVADSGTRIVLQIGDIPSGVGLNLSSATVTSERFFQLRRVLDYGADYAGGDQTPETQVEIVGNTATLVYEVTQAKAPRGSVPEFPEVIEIEVDCNGTDGLARARFTAWLAPVSFDGVIRTLSPEPRFIDPRPAR